jgi:hypothetical protein
MEDVLEVYQRSYNPRHPVVCMDEQPTQLIKETRIPLPRAPGQPERFDYEYERGGTASVFLFTEPLADWRRVSARERRTKQDFAEEIRKLLEEDSPEAEQVILVCDNLNTHTPGALYEAFTPKKARQLLERLDFHYTPKHGSWLNIAEIELSVFTRQCLDRRLPDLARLRREMAAWNHDRNAQKKHVDWQFTTEDARIKLKRLYPQFQLC